MAEAMQRTPNLGLWGWLIVVGLALVALATLIRLLSNLGDLPNDEVAPAVFGTLGHLVAALALVAAGLWWAGGSAGIRTALLLAGCYFMLTTNSLLTAFASFL